MSIKMGQFIKLAEFGKILDLNMRSLSLFFLRHGDSWSLKKESQSVKACDHQRAKEKAEATMGMVIQATIFH